MPPKISVGPFHFTSVGVRIGGKPELAEWKGPLQFALWCQRAGPWWIGDLLNAGEDRFGETFSQMCEGAVSAEMLNRYASVARRVPIENRRAGPLLVGPRGASPGCRTICSTTCCWRPNATAGRATSCEPRPARP